MAVDLNPQPAPVSQEDAAQMAHAHQLMAGGKFAEATTAFAAVVRADKELRGDQDPKTLSDRLELAVAQGKAGDSIQAEGELRALLAVFTRREGADHDLTLNCRSALARLLADVGRSHEAIDEYRQVLERRERTLGAEDIEVARVRHALADALTQAKDYEGAIPQFEKAEPVFEKVLGAEAPETLLNRSNLALAKAEHRDFAASAKELREILAIRERALGPTDVSVLMTCYELGRVLGGDGQYAEALVYASRAEEGLPNVLSPSSHAAVNARTLCVEIRADLKRTSAAKSTPAPAR
jgi:tetratricopeptide (TPR) repeat protein